LPKKGRSRKEAGHPKSNALLDKKEKFENRILYVNVKSLIKYFVKRVAFEVFYENILSFMSVVDMDVQALGVAYLADIWVNSAYP